jgi:hypothetical protein
MSRWNYKEIFQREWDAAREDGCSEAEADKRAKDRADDAYWDRVDEGRQRAKDGER